MIRINVRCFALSQSLHCMFSSIHVMDMHAARMHLIVNRIDQIFKFANRFIKRIYITYIHIVAMYTIYNLKEQSPNVCSSTTALYSNALSQPVSIKHIRNHVTTWFPSVAPMKCITNSVYGFEYGKRQTQSLATFEHVNTQTQQYSDWSLIFGFVCFYSEYKKRIIRSKFSY